MQGELTRLNAERMEILIELKSSMKICKFLHEAYMDVFKEHEVQATKEELSEALIKRVTNYIALQTPDLALQEQEKQNERSEEEGTTISPGEERGDDGTPPGETSEGGTNNNDEPQERASDSDGGDDEVGSNSSN